MRMWKHIFLGPITGWTLMLSPEGVKAQQFYLALVGEANLWNETPRPINVDWNRLQNQF